MSRQNPLLYAVMARWSAVNLKTHLLGDRLSRGKFAQYEKAGINAPDSAHHTSAATPVIRAGWGL